MRPAILAAAWVCLAAVPAAADDTPIMVRFTTTLADFQGKVRADDGGVAGSNLDVDSLLRTEDNQAALGGTLRFPLFWQLRANIDYWGQGVEGTTTLGAPIIYGGSVYTAGSRVESALDLHVVTATIEYDHSFGISEHSSVRISGLLGARYIDFDSSLKNTNALIPFTERESFSIFLPTTGLRSELQITDWWTVELMGQWFSMNDLGDRDVATAEFLGETRFNFFQGAFVGAGWRWTDFDISDRSKAGERLDMDLEVDGIFLEIGYTF